MNGMFNNNFIMGMLLARDLPREDQFLTGLVAGQMPTDSALGAILLKPGIDKQVKAASDRATAAAEATGLRPPLQIEVASEVDTVTLSVPGVTGATFALDAARSSPGTTVDPTTGAVGLPAENVKATVVIGVNGVAREVTVVRATGSAITPAPIARGVPGDGGADAQAGGASTRSSRRTEAYSPPEAGAKTATPA